jgi:hypothetical protein
VRFDVASLLWGDVYGNDYGRIAVAPMLQSFVVPDHKVTAARAATTWWTTKVLASFFEDAAGALEDALMSYGAWRSGATPLLGGGWGIAIYVARLVTDVAHAMTDLIDFIVNTWKTVADDPILPVSIDSTNYEIVVEEIDRLKAEAMRRRRTRHGALEGILGGTAEQRHRFIDRYLAWRRLPILYAAVTAVYRFILALMNANTSPRDATLHQMEGYLTELEMEIARTWAVPSDEWSALAYETFQISGEIGVSQEQANRAGEAFASFIRTSAKAADALVAEMQRLITTAKGALPPRV